MRSELRRLREITQRLLVSDASDGAHLAKALESVLAVKDGRASNGQVVAAAASAGLTTTSPLTQMTQKPSKHRIMQSSSSSPVVNDSAAKGKRLRLGAACPLRLPPMLLQAEEEMMMPTLSRKNGARYGGGSDAAAAAASSAAVVEAVEAEAARHAMMEHEALKALEGVVRVYASDELSQANDDNDGDDDDADGEGGSSSGGASGSGSGSSGGKKASFSGQVSIGGRVYFVLLAKKEEDREEWKKEEKERVCVVKFCKAASEASSEHFANYLASRCGVKQLPPVLLVRKPPPLPSPLPAAATTSAAAAETTAAAAAAAGTEGGLIGGNSGGHNPNGYLNGYLNLQASVSERLKECQENKAEERTLLANLPAAAVAAVASRETVPSALLSLAEDLNRSSCFLLQVRRFRPLLLPLDPPQFLLVWPSTGIWTNN
jgi:hypothetical protein